MSDTEKVVEQVEGVNNDDKDVESVKSGETTEKEEKGDKRKMTEEEKLKKTREVAEKLPKLSLVTPAHNCKKTFFILLGNFMMLNYPAEKLEWIIIDDGDYSIDNLIPPKDSRIKYYYIDNGSKIYLYEKMVESLKKKKSAGGSKKSKRKKGGLRDIHKDIFYERRLPIGMKRNIGCQYATGDIIMHFDSDYFYPFDSAYVKAVALSMEENKQMDIVGSFQIGAFHAKRMVSLLYNDVGNMALNRRINTASLCYRKSFWEKKKFDNQDIEKEAEMFLKNENDKIYTMDGLYTTVLVLHEDIKDKYPKVFEKALEQEESNGWHFGKIPNRFFVDITDIDGKEEE
jgi:glycosyltransferase involved in cell wall biosynthesis